MKGNHLTVAIFMAVILVIAGCTNNQNPQQSGSRSQSNPTEVKWEEQIDQTPASEAKKYVENERKEMTDVHAINSKKELHVAVKFKTFDAFNTQQLTKKVQKHLQKQFPKYKVQVSSDRKIYQQISKVEGAIQSKQINKQTLKKRMEKINQFFKNQ